MSNPQSLNYRLLLDLDALLDTRLGTLLLLDKPSAALAIKNGYHTRTMDDMETLTEGRVTNEQFKEAYAKRNVETLKKSIISGIPHVLVSYIESIRERVVRKIEIDKVSIDVNVYPYTLSGPTAELLMHAFGTIIPEFVTIGIVNYSNAVLNPVSFKGQYDGWVTYDFDAWFTMYAEELLMKRANELTVILPRLHLSKPGEGDNAELDGFKDLDKHNLHAMVMEEFIKLEYLPVCDFCFFTPGTYQSPYDDHTSSESGTSEGSASGSSTKSA